MLLDDLSSLECEDVLRSFSKLLGYGSRYASAVLAHIAVIDAKNFYLAEGFESMKAFCMARMDVSADGAYKRIQVARVARQFPQLFSSIANGRLTVSAVRLLAPRLNSGNVNELIEAAASRTVLEIEELLATRFPEAMKLRLDDGLSVQAITHEPIPQQVTMNTAQVVVAQHPNCDPVATWQPEFVESITPKLRSTLKPSSASAYNLQVNLSRETHDKLRRLQELLGHAVPNGDLAQVIDRALDEAIPQYERRMFGLGAREGRKVKPSVRSIPAQIKKAVYDRDGGQCTFRYPDGKRCQRRKPIEFDHIEPLAKGGKTTVDNLRLLCRAHNQHAADQAFGQKFMDAKRASRRPFAGAPKGSRRGSAPVRSRR